MVRPKKKPGMVKDKDVRLTLTAEQKERLTKAAELLELDFTAWARPILLKAADKVITDFGAELNE